jgi:hypothetical protein
MSDEIIVASTTDTPEAVKAAAGVVEEPEEARGEQERAEETAAAESGDAEAQPEEAAEAEAEEEAGTGERNKEAPQPKRSRGGFQRRLEKLTRRNDELEGQLAGLRESLRQLQTAGEKAPAQSAQQEGAGAKPQADQFSSYEEYLEALADWKASQRIQAELQRAEQQRAEIQEQEAARARLDTYTERVDEAKAKYEDFDEVVGRDDIMIPQAVHLAVVESANGPDVAYYLGKHPSVCRELQQMSPVAAVVEVGRISRMLEGGAAIRSKAPAPARTLDGSSHQSTVPLDQMDYREYRRVRDQQARR